MKKLNKTIYITLVAFLTIMAGCSSDDDNTPETPEDLGATATITLADGVILDFKSTFYTTVSLFGQELGVGFTNANSGMHIYMDIGSNETLVPGTHDGSLTISQIGGNSDIIDESYDSHNNEGAETQEEGSSILTITSMGNNRMQGTFSGILYSASGKKLTIDDGVFDIETDGYVID